MLSYMTYLLQPYPDDMKKLQPATKNRLRTAYYSHLQSVNFDINKLLDLVTFSCEDYVFSSTSSFASCTRDFSSHHYSIGGKCFTSHGSFNGEGKAINLDLRTKPSRTKKIDVSVASEDSTFYSNMFIYVTDEQMNPQAIAYKDLTPLRINGYSIVLVEKQTVDRTKQNRAIEVPECIDDPAYKHEDCVR